MYIAATIPVFTFFLGNWQLDRLQWKLMLIDELDEKLRRTPLRMPKNINIDVLNEFSFRLFEVCGTFDVSRTLFMGPRTHEGARGYQLVMPFRRDDGGPDILVNRGFVDNNAIEGTGMNKRLKHSLPDDNKRVTITALLPRVYPCSRFALPNEPHNNLWMQLNPAQMAAWLNEKAGLQDLGASSLEENKAMSPRGWWSLLGSSMNPPSMPPAEAFSSRKNQRVLPVYVEQIFTGTFSEAAAMMKQGVPVGRPPRIELRNQHMEYAVTWFSLSAISSLMFVYMLRKGRTVE
ncbi:surf-like protein [Malassezia vespertilionis]|uniref:SURF1-like protein n=1 Tax=Malassezia vespertilionis TaxID=2020962 RepID=A0A2N1JBU2_9BASI|nr:surf-like protein [Malassezia vespertilionis]PKI84020.1 Shy1p [Malassezia vespertilionis]WFD06686.1 surf-like protein [Malassezia vespertilionis]